MLNPTHSLTHLYLGVDGQSRPFMRPCMFGPMHNRNTTEAQDNLLVALANRTRVFGLTVPNSSGSMVRAAMMEI